jgi:hypothetical protein
LAILQQLQDCLELDLKASTSSCLISQLLRYNVLTVGGFLHRPHELLAPSLGISEPHLQASNLFLGVLQGGVEILLMVVETYEITQVSTPQK